MTHDSLDISNKKFQEAIDYTNSASREFRVAKDQSATMGPAMMAIGVSNFGAIHSRGLRFRLIIRDGVETFHAACNCAYHCCNHLKTFFANRLDRVLIASLAGTGATLEIPMYPEYDIWCRVILHDTRDGEMYGVQLSVNGLPGNEHHPRFDFQLGSIPVLTTSMSLKGMIEDAASIILDKLELDGYNPCCFECDVNAVEMTNPMDVWCIITQSLCTRCLNKKVVLRDAIPEYNAETQPKVHLNEVIDSSQVLERWGEVKTSYAQGGPLPPIPGIASSSFVRATRITGKIGGKPITNGPTGLMQIVPSTFGSANPGVSGPATSTSTLKPRTQEQIDQLLKQKGMK